MNLQAQIESVPDVCDALMQEFLAIELLASGAIEENEFHWIQEAGVRIGEA